MKLKSTAKEVVYNVALTDEELGLVSCALFKYGNACASDGRDLRAAETKELLDDVRNILYGDDND